MSGRGGAGWSFPVPGQDAKKAIQKWKTGTVHMSGTVAERLFKLLPPRMPLADKYQLFESLWNHVGVKSKKILRVGVDATDDKVLDAVRKHFDDVVIHYGISEWLERRFNWLAAGDAHVKQELLNHPQQYEKQLVAKAVRVQLPVMIQHLRSEAGQYTNRLVQVLKIGKHELELALDKNASGVAVVEPWVAQPSVAAAAINQDASYKWVWWVIIAIVVFFLIMGK